jgi:hypothetical protein
MEMKSLYEYLGRAAGSELGKAVATAATRAKVKIDSHEVSNSKYTGTILKYPVSFLNEYFGKDMPHTITAAESEKDSLPF